jgi:hypothetical protein
VARVLSLVSIVPPARYDAVPWSGAQVEESKTPDASTLWTTIDTVQLTTPLDTDPSDPAPRTVTTSNATLPTGWYRIVFVDTAGGTSEPSDAIRNSIRNSIATDMPPDPGAVRDASPLLRQNIPLPTTDPFALSDLRNYVYSATAYVQSMTWRILDPTLACSAPDDYSCEALPDSMVPMAFQAIRLLTERYSVLADPEYAEQNASGRLLRGFSAGPYSENYFAPGEFARKGTTGRPAVDNDTTVDGLLWGLMTEDARDYFIFRAEGVSPPVGIVTPFDYRRQSIGYPGAGGMPVGGGHGGPDGF